MKILRCVVQAIAPVACGALVLSVVAGDAMAAKKPPVHLIWPSGANLAVKYYPAYPGSMGARLLVAWPIADGADHYRLTVIAKGKHSGPRVVYDQSPVAYQVGLDGQAYIESGALVAYGSVLITVTAYSVPNEAEAYSESLQASIDIPMPYPWSW
jgi:hypothetical protein